MKVDSFKPCPLLSPHICCTYFVRLIFLDERILPPSHSSTSTQPLPSPSYLPLLPRVEYTTIYTHTKSANSCMHVRTHRYTFKHSAHAYYTHTQKHTESANACTHVQSTRTHECPHCDNTNYRTEELSTQLYGSHTSQQDSQTQESVRHSFPRVVMAS